MNTIENYENYIIFSDGVVINGNTGYKLNPSINRDGYYQLGLYKNGKRKFFKLHRLLALGFIPNPKNKSLIDHINRDKIDNRLSNLRWATPLENQQNKGNNKTNTSGFKNVSLNNGYWRFKKTINKKVYSKNFYTKEDAINYKNEFYLKNNILE